MWTSMTGRGRGQGGNYRSREPRASVLVSRGGETGAGGVLARDGPLVPGPDPNSRPLRVRPVRKRPGGGALDARGGRGAFRPGHARRVETGGGEASARPERTVGAGACDPHGGDDRPCGGKQRTCPGKAPGADRGPVGGGGEPSHAAPAGSS